MANENKIIDLDRLKEYTSKMKEHFIAKEIKVEDADKRYDAEEVETALKEISDIIGYFKGEKVLFDGDITTGDTFFGGLGYKAIISRKFRFILDDSYSIEIDGVPSDCHTTDKYQLIVDGDGSLPKFSLDENGVCFTQEASTTYHIKITGREAVYPSTQLIANHNIVDGAEDYALQTRLSKATGHATVALGVENIASDIYATTAGGYNTASGAGATAFGYGNTASNTVAVAIGQGSSAEGDKSIAMGYDNHAIADYSSAIGGWSNSVTGPQSTIIGGIQAAASGTQAIVAGGQGCEAAANWAATLGGRNNHAKGAVATIVGGMADTASANGSIILGGANVKIGSDATSAAAINAGRLTLNGEASLALNVSGGNSTYTGKNQVLVGNYPKDVPGIDINHSPTAEDYKNSRIFVVGGGKSSTNLSNAEATSMLGDKFMHGDVYVHCEDDSTGGQKLLRPSEMGIPTYDATKTYQINQVVYEPNTDKFYRCKTAITEAAGDFDSTKWTEIKFGEGYLARNNPTGTGALSLNRKSGSAVGENSVAVGTECQATGSNAFAGGSKSKAVGSNSFAFGTSSTANGTLSFAFGNQAVAGLSGTTSSKMIAIGASAKADGDSSIAIGSSAKAGVDNDGTEKRGGGGSIAIGSNAKATFTQAIALGPSSVATAARATAVGSSALADQNDAVAIGRMSYAHNHKSTALGWYASAVSPGQLARGKANIEDPNTQYADILGWGDITEISGSDDVVVRKNIEATTTTGNKKMKGIVYVHSNDDSSGGTPLIAQSSIAAQYDASSAYAVDDTCVYEGDLYKCNTAIGSSGEAWNPAHWTKTNVLALTGGGGGNYLEKQNPTGTGYLSMNRKAGSTIGDYATALGKDNTVSGQYAGAFGHDNTVSGSSAFAIGASNSVAGEGDAAIGTSNNMNVSAKYSLTVGYGNAASSEGGLAVGLHSSSAGKYAFATGSYALAKGEASVAEGFHTYAGSSMQHVQGRWNVKDEASTYVDIIGNGDSDTIRKNIEATTFTGEKRMKSEVFVECEDDSTGGVCLSRPSIITNYFDPTLAYEIGDLVTSKADGNLYKANKAKAAGAAWVAADWDITNVMESIAGNDYATKAEVEAMFDGIFG